MKEYKEYIKKLLSSKKRTKKFLIRAGIINLKGNLTKKYK